MNKRIKELLDQACVPIGQRNQVLEKFAELIVQECAAVAYSYEPTEEYASKIAKLIQEHFGVKK